MSDTPESDTPQEQPVVDLRGRSIVVIHAVKAMEEDFNALDFDVQGFVDTTFPQDDGWVAVEAAVLIPDPLAALEAQFTVEDEA